MEFKIGNEALASYKRLDYTPWHALAEFIDNSTQAYFNNQKELESLYKKTGEKLTVKITYDEANDLLRITDNACGMDTKDLERALTVGKPPPNTNGRSRYGMGLKTAACWFGDNWSIQTKKHGKDQGIRVDLNIPDVIAGKKSGVKDSPLKGMPKDLHYTTIEISKLHRKLKGRTKGKIKQFLSSMYREDLRNNRLSLWWDEEEIAWTEIDSNIFVGSDGRRWKKDFSFEVDGKKVKGWVAILHRGSRENAGFSILHCGRVIKGWPDSWRPTSLFGQDLGTNDLINQRLVGEIHLDPFEVTHTKDAILWEGDDENEVLEKLKEKCADYREEARKSRNPKRDQPVDTRGASERAIALAAEEFKAEITSSEMIDALRLEEVLPEKAVNEIKEKILETVKPSIPILETRLDEISVRVYLEPLSISDPYVTVSADQDHEVVVTVNKSHPHFSEYVNEHEVMNYLRHCVYDAIAEWKARKKTSRIDPDTIKMIKDQYLRIKLKMEEHRQDEEGDSVA